MSVVSNNAKGEPLVIQEAPSGSKPNGPTVDQLKKQLIDAGQDSAEINKLKKDELLAKVAELETSSDAGGPADPQGPEE